MHLVEHAAYNYDTLIEQSPLYSNPLLKSLSISFSSFNKYLKGHAPDSLNYYTSHASVLDMLKGVGYHLIRFHSITFDFAPDFLTCLRGIYQIEIGMLYNTVHMLGHLSQSILFKHIQYMAICILIILLFNPN